MKVNRFQVGKMQKDPQTHHNKSIESERQGKNLESSMEKNHTPLTWKFH